MSKKIMKKIENVAEYIKEKAEHRGWENAEYMAADKFGEDLTLKAIQWLSRNDGATIDEVNRIKIGEIGYETGI